VFQPGTPVTTLERWLRRPALHFLVAGGLLFILAPPDPTPTERAIVITAAQVDALRDEFVQRTGLLPSMDEEAALIRHAVDVEVLYREALTLALDRDDRSVRHRVVEKMRFLGSAAERDPEALYREALDIGLDRDDPIVRRMLVEKMRLLATTMSPPPEDELERFFAARQDRYRAPGRISLRHVFFSAQRRGIGLRRDAASLGARHLPPEEAIALGDPFPLGHRFAAVAEQDLARTFGSDFARAAMALPAGTWSDPVPSPYGLHLVWIDTVEPPALPPFAVVRGRVLEDYRTERRETVLRDAVARLRARYQVRIEGHA